MGLRALSPALVSLTETAGARPERPGTHEAPPERPVTTVPHPPGRINRNVPNAGHHCLTCIAHLQGFCVQGSFCHCIRSCCATGSLGGGGAAGPRDAIAGRRSPRPPSLPCHRDHRRRRVTGTCCSQKGNRPRPPAMEEEGTTCDACGSCGTARPRVSGQPLVLLGCRSGMAGPK